MNAPSQLHRGPRTRRIGARRRRPDRRGISVLIVLLLISMTLSVSYALVRTQTTAARVQTNSQRVDQARQAALTGLAVGLRKMHESAWLGVGTTSVVNVSSTDSFAVSYIAGDPTLTGASPDFADFPYRVTIGVTGYSQDPADVHSVSSHAVQAVVQLAPRALGTQPAEWAAMQNYLLYQTKEQDDEFNPPAQIQGPVRLQGTVQLANDYLWNPAPRDRFFGDTNAMRGAGYGDNRLFTSAVHLPMSENGGAVYTLLASLGLAFPDEPITPQPNLFLNASPSTYRLYAGGPSYTIPLLPGTLVGVTYQPDVSTNPLGLFYAPSNLTVGSNVALRGTLLTHGEVSFTGNGIVLLPNDLPSLVGTTTPVRLPTLAVRQNVSFESGSNVQLNGAVLAGQQFDVPGGALSTALRLTGRAVAESFHFMGRTEWDKTAAGWSGNWLQFTIQYTTKPVGVRVEYYPLYASSTFGLPLEPQIVVAPDATPVNSHWQDLSQPIYAPAAGDAGLRWDLVRWADNP